MPTTRLAFVLSLAALAGASSVARAAIIFDNLTGAATPTFGPECCRIANEITFSGAGRGIDRIRLGVATQGADIIADIEIGIYANDGPGGGPGTLLRQLDPYFGLYIPSGSRYVSLTVPRVGAPNVVIIASRILASGPVALGRLSPAPPTVGALNRTWIETAPDLWTSPGFGFAMEVRAIPEPASSLLAIPGIAAIALARVLAKRRRVTSP